MEGKGYTSVPSSAKKSTQLTGFLTCKHFFSSPVSISQNRIVSSYEPLISRLPAAQHQRHTPISLIPQTVQGTGGRERRTPQKQRRAEIRMPIEEPHALRERVPEIRLAVVERAVERFPARSQPHKKRVSMSIFYHNRTLKASRGGSSGQGRKGRRHGKEG